MRKLILFLLVFVSAKVSAQVYQEMPQYGYRANRMAFDSTLQIPTVCGVPTLKSVVKANKNGAIAYDSCNAVFYTYSPKTQTWSAVSGGGATDTTSLSNRINLKLNISDTATMLNSYLRKIDTTNKFVNSITRTLGKDSIIYFIGGNRFAIKDSVANTTGFIPYTGATQDVDLGVQKISAQSFQVEGTNGLGHIHFKHQNSDATATGQSTVLYANSNGDLKYKNAGNYYSTLKTQQTADRVYTFQNKSYTLADSSDLTSKLNSNDTASLSNRINLKLNISDTTTLQPKSISSYSILANNTSATANVTAQQFRDTSAVYSGTITWTGTTAPSGATNHTYRYTQVGKCVTINISLVYATNGTQITRLVATLPSGAPTPAQPTGLTGASQIIYVTYAQLITSTNTTSNAIARSTFRNNAANNGFEFLIDCSILSAAQASITCQYWTN